MAKKQRNYRPEDFDEIEEAPSRSQLKRESAELQKLGLDFAALGENIIKESGLPPEVEEALLRLKTISKHEARRRHLQYIGKMMRTFDTTHVREIVEAAEKGHSLKTADFHRIEVMREQLIDGDNELLQELFESHPEEGQRLRQLVLGARREKANAKPPKNTRALFKLLRSLLVETKK
jgi:ribosome-associated protein